MSRAAQAGLIGPATRRWGAMSSRARLPSFLVALAVLILVAGGCSGDGEVVVSSPSIEPSVEGAEPADAGSGADAGSQADAPATTGDEAEEESGGFELPPLGDGATADGDAGDEGASEGDTSGSAQLEAGFLQQAVEVTSGSTSYRYEMSFAMRISDPSMSLDVSPDEPLAVGAISGNTSWMLLDMGGMFDAIAESLPPGQAAEMDRMLGDDLTMEIITDGDALMYLRAPMLASLAAQGQMPGAGELGALGDGWGTVDISRSGLLSAEELAELTGAQASASPEAMMELLREAADITEVGRVDVRGVTTTHLRARVSLRAMIEAQGVDLEQFGAMLDVDSVLGVVLPFEVYVDDDDRVRRVELTMDLASIEDVVGETAPQGTEFSYTTSIDMFDFGADITITPPPADQIVGDITDVFLGLGG